MSNDTTLIYYTSKVNLIYVAVESVIAIVITIANLLLLLVCYTLRRRMKTHHKYIASMAFADLLLGLIAIPINLCTIYGFPREPYLCYFALSVEIFIANAGILALVITCIEKYLKIVDCMRYGQYMTDVNSNGLFALKSRLKMF